MTENSKEEQIAKRKAAASEFSNDLATLPKMYQCTKKPHRPIFPVRHSLRPSFIASNTEQKSLGIEPKGLNMTNTHWLETVRQGFIYIYAPDGHQGDTASDINKKWMVFRYNTDVNDINSKISYKFIDTENKEGYPHFIKYRFENQNSSTQLGTTSDNWKREGVYPAPFIHDDTSEVYIAYSEYPWTPALFEKIESDDTELRDIIMTKVNPVPLNKKTEKPKYALPQEQVNLLKEIDNYVINFSLQSHKQNAIDEFKKKDLAAINLQRYTKILPATVTFCTDELEKGLFVVLTDTLGEIRELQSQHILLADKRGRYLSDYRYPMTIGSVIDPHLALSVRGKTPPNEPTIRKKLIAAYEESEKSWFGAKKEFALVSSFEDEYKKLLQDDFDKHFKPITAVLSNLRLLRERQSLTKLLLQLEIDSKKAATDNNKVKTCIVSTGNYLSIVSDCLYSLQESEQGWLELTNLFEGKNNTESKQDKNKNKNKDKDKDKVAFPEIPKWIDILDKVNELSETFEEAPAAGFASNSRYIVYAGIDRISLSLGEKLAELAVLGGKKATALFNAMMKCYGVTFEAAPMTYYEMIMQQYKFGGTNKSFDIKYKQNSYSKAIKVRNMNNIKVSSATFSLLTLYAGLMNLSQISSQPPTPKTTKLGQLGADPVLLFGAAILDTGAALQKLMNINFIKSLGGLGLAVTSVINFCDAVEAWNNENYLKVVGNMYYIVGGITVWAGAGIAGLLVSGQTSIAIAGGLSIGLGLFTVSSALMLSGIGILLLVIGYWFMRFSDSELETWVKKGFWGTGDNYKFWKEDRLKTDSGKFDIDRQKIKAKLLGNKKLQEDYYQWQLDNSQTTLPEYLKEYEQVSLGFRLEMHHLALISGIQIRAVEGGFRLDCMEFNYDRQGELVIHYAEEKDGYYSKREGYQHEYVKWYTKKLSVPPKGISVTFTLPSSNPKSIQAVYTNAKKEEIRGELNSDSYQLNLLF